MVQRRAHGRENLVISPKPPRILPPPADEQHHQTSSLASAIGPTSPERAGRLLDLASNRAATACQPCSPPSLPVTHREGLHHHCTGTPLRPREPMSRPPPPQPQQQTHTPMLPEFLAPPLAAGKWLGGEVDGEEEEEERLMVR